MTEFTGTPRSYLKASLEAAGHDHWTVHARPMIPEQVPRDTAILSLWRNELLPGAATTSLDHQFTVNLYVSRTSTDALEEELEGELDALLLALQPLGAVSWSSAARANWRDGTVTGWRVAVKVTSGNYYKTHHLTQGVTP